MKRISTMTALALCLAGLHGTAAASGFAIIEHSASGMGNAYAGAAAIAEDGSTIWFNPAGMMKLKGSQVVIAGHYLKPNSAFENKGSTTAFGAPLSGDDDDWEVGAIIPNFYWVTSLNEEMKFGLGVNAPFGLVTDYDDTWVGRYHAVRSDMQTVNFNPSIAYQASDRLSLGGGLNVMLADVTLTSAIDFGALLGAPESADGFVELQGDNMNSLGDLSYGFNLGLLFDVTPMTSIGLAYRSEIKVDVEGEAEFLVPLAAAPVLSSGAFQDSGLSASVTLPQSFSVSVAHQMDKVKLLADITWIGWSSFEELRIKYDNPLQPDSVTTEDWENTFRYSFGVDWQYSDKVILRAGVAYDETPIPSAERRTARIPGNNRTWLSLGGTYVIDEDFTVDIGYSHIFIDDTEINNEFESSQPALGAVLIGEYTATVDIISAQLRWNY
jgi:long-chain fatty acid transport protein